MIIEGPIHIGVVDNPDEIPPGETILVEMAPDLSVPTLLATRH